MVLRFSLCRPSAELCRCSFPFFAFRLCYCICNPSMKLSDVLVTRKDLPQLLAKTQCLLKTSFLKLNGQLVKCFRTPLGNLNRGSLERWNILRIRHHPPKSLKAFSQRNLWRAHNRLCFGCQFIEFRLGSPNSVKHD